MGRGRLYAASVFGLLMVAGVLAWRYWSHTSAGSFDPVSAVIGVAGLAVSVAGFGLAVRAQRQSDTDVAGVAARLAVAVEQEETEARRQLLGGYNRTINVQFAFQPAPGHEVTGAWLAGTLEHIVAYYRKLQPQRMVITGAPGSGKTVLAIELILGLLKDRPADAPVPVRMSAASLDTSRPPHVAVADWIAENLRRAYKIPGAAAHQLVAAQMVLPVIDGLDEMDSTEAPTYASRAGQAIRACNAYLDGQQKAAMVLTCRISQYDALEQAREWVHDAARVQLRPVGIPAARSFLTSRVTEKARWQPVLDRMQQPGSPPLVRAMSTPWRLTLAVAVYEQRDPATGSYLRDPADLTGPGLDTEEKIRDHLLGLYILAAVAARGGRYPASHVRRWLEVLAGYLNANTAGSARAPRMIAGRPLSGVDLVLYELWPAAGTRLPRILTAGIIVTFLLTVWARVLIKDTSNGFTLKLTIFIASFAIVSVVIILAAWEAWPKPTLLDIRRIKTSLGRRKFLAELPIWLGLGLGLGFGLVLEFVVGLRAEIGLWIGIGLVAGFVGALRDDNGEYSAVEPREIIRADFVAGLVAGLVGGLAAWPVFVLRSDSSDSVLWIGSAFWIGSTVIVVLVIGRASFRYIVLLVCARRWTDHWLPWRLGGFLHWCYQAGLIRVAGIGYQFRHRELQDYLARNSTLKNRLLPVPTAGALSLDAFGVNPVQQDSTATYAQTASMHNR